MSIRLTELHVEVKRACIYRKLILLPSTGALTQLKKLIMEQKIPSCCHLCGKVITSCSLSVQPRFSVTVTYELCASCAQTPRLRQQITSDGKLIQSKLFALSQVSVNEDALIC